ncbi:MAG: hypothetical protein Q9184_006429 [Pyrenodesmia sp. 2 TL-2023]
MTDSEFGIQSDFGIQATSSFARYINVTKCSPLVDYASIIGGLTPAAIFGLSPPATSPAFTPNQTATTFPPRAAPWTTFNFLPQPTTEPLKPSLSAGAKAAIGVSVPFTILITFAILVLAILRHRKNKRMNQASDHKSTTASSSEGQPYFQQKGELEAKESALFELSAEQPQHELDPQTEIREMPAVTGGSHERSCQRQELRGEEHCGELRGEEGYREME